MLTGFLLVLAVLVLLPLAFFWFVGERGRFLPSTWALLRQGGARLSTLHGYIYSRWTPQYVKALFSATGSSPKATKAEYWLSDHYHGKVLTPEHAHAIVSVNEPLVRRNLDQIIPYPVARDLVLQAPLDIVAYDCVCRKARGKNCSPTQVCMIVGKPFTDLVLEHQPQSARRLTRDEALELLRAEHERGHVHSAWFKDAMLNRFYAICNCCKCCCGGIREMVQRGVPIVTSSGYVAQIDTMLCAHCGDCIETCPFEAVAWDDGAVAHSWDKCMGCGACEVKCRNGAVSMVRDERKGTPLDVRALAHT
jgi:NAD-dependent dihydropyrimidine dehydrogenase PreA subunit